MDGAQIDSSIQRVRETASLTRANWTLIGSELDARARFYSRLGSGERLERTGGCVLYSDLFYRSSRHPLVVAPGEWEWIFEPLVCELFRAGQAIWVCLGHFTGDSRRSERNWTYYFSEKLSSGDAFARAFRHLSFNASFALLAEDTYLVTSRLLESVLPSPVARTPKDEPEKRLLYQKPLAVELGGAGFVADLGDVRNLYLWLVKWRDIFEKSQTGERAQILSTVCDDDFVMKWVEHQRAARRPGAGAEKRIDFLWKTPTKDEMDVAHSYAQALKGFNRPITPSERAELNEYWENVVLRFSDEDVDAKLARYVAWIHDTSPDAGGLITVPAWLPGEGSVGRSGAMIICTAKNAALSYQEMLMMINAFRLGSVNIALEAGRGLLRKGSHHHIPKLFAAGIDHLVEFQEEHERKSPNCKVRFEIPPEFILAIGSLYRLSKDQRCRPRWLKWEKRLKTHGISPDFIKWLFVHVAAKLGLARLQADDVSVNEGESPKLLVAGKWDVKAAQIGDEEAMYLPALIAAMLTEAWEHTVRASEGASGRRVVRVKISSTQLTISNPCKSGTTYKEGSNGAWNTEAILRNLRGWAVEPPDDKQLAQNRWTQRIWKVKSQHA